MATTSSNVLPHALAPWHSLTDWLFGSRRATTPPTQPPAARPAWRPGSSLRALGHPGARRTGALAEPRGRAAPTLRVLQVTEAGGRAASGRIVISGRMADVCAELDRLAAQEARREALARSQRAAPTR